MARAVADLRPDLERIAAGRTLAEVFEAGTVLDPAAVEKLQGAMRPWKSFAEASLEGGGERLAAPAELLTPLP